MKNQALSRRSLTVLRGLDNAVEWLEKAVLVSGILAMAVLNIANVAARNLFNNSLTSAEELNQALIVLVTFMGLGYGVRQARHIRMSAFYEQLTGRPRKALMTFIAAGTAALLFLLAWYATVHVLHLYSVGSVTPALGIPLYVVQAVVPVGLALGGIQYVLTVVRNAISPGTWLSFVEKDIHHETDIGML